MNLSPDHLRQLTEDSAIAPAVVQERGCYTIRTTAQLHALHFPAYQRRVPGLLFPVHTTDGQVLPIVYRPDTPRLVDGTPRKYDQAEDSPVRLDCPPRCRAALLNPDVPLWITEGYKKGDSLASRGVCALDLPGVWGFRVPKTIDPRQPPLPDWRYVQLADRIVTIVFDSDVSRNTHVAQARDVLAQFLAGRGAHVRYCTLPPQASGAKCGVDDYFALGHTLADLERLSTDATQARAAQAHLLQADTIQEEEVQYLWEPYIPRKMATLLDGDPGVGKTGLACLIAASVTQGWTLPDQLGVPQRHGALPGHVLMVAMEDHLAAVIIPRLKRRGADLSRITFVNDITDAAGKPRPFALPDLPLLADYFARVQPRFVYIDAIQAVLGAKVDINRANQVTALLAPLKTLAEQYDCAVLCSRHPAKPGQQVAKVLYRGMGSQAFVGTVRSGLFVEEHPGDERQSLLVHYKANARGLGRTMLFSKAHGVFEWVRVSRITHRALAGDMSPGPFPHQKLKAALWLETRLKGKGEGVPASVIQQEAEEQHDWSRKVMRAAADCIGVTKTQVTADFLWTLPPLSLTTGTSGGSGGIEGMGEIGGIGVDSLSQAETPVEGTYCPVEGQDTQDTLDHQDHPIHPILSPGGAADPYLSPLEGVPDCQSLNGTAPPAVPCAVCGGGVRWDDHGTARCVACWPPP
jgi:hypothetical protein